MTRSRWTVLGLAVVSAVLYTWGLSRVGYGNTYYAAAVRSATTSWKAFFFGSLDPGSFITVDKPPFALWVQGLSARLFGFSSWSMLMPEAAAGVGSVLVLHRLVRRWAGEVAGLLAGLALALTPVAVVMFRYNNPDAVLTFLLLLAAWALWSAVETGRTWWLVLSGALVGLAFETKMLQAFVVLPAFGLVYLWAGPPKLGRRIGQLLAGGAALLVSAGWWVAAVAFWPASARPYIGSTTDNSILSLVFGYNGFSRIFGRSGGPGPGGPGGGGPGFGGSPGWLRLFNIENGTQIAWLIPLAAVGLAAGLWLSRGRARTDRWRAGWLLWGGWFMVTAIVFSKAQGIFHPYYSVALAPAVAALAGAGAVALWRIGLGTRRLRWLLPAAIGTTAMFAVALLNRTPTYYPWLRPVIVLAAAVGVLGVWLAFDARRLLAVGAVAAGVALLAGPAAYTLTTIGQPASGSLVAAGPAGTLGPAGAVGPAGAAGAVGPAGAAGPGPDVNSSVDGSLISFLEANQGEATYIVAAFGSQASAPIIIATGKAVMTIGGFNGSDPAPTLSEFQAMVAAGKVRYVLLGGRGPGRDQVIEQWVLQHGRLVTGSLYDLSGGSRNE